MDSAGMGILPVCKHQFQSHRTATDWNAVLTDTAIEFTEENNRVTAMREAICSMVYKERFVFPI
jgi:hypothetical protein